LQIVNKTAFPCGTCLVPNYELFKISKKYVARTHSHMKVIYAKAKVEMSQYGTITQGRNRLKNISLRENESLFLPYQGINIYYQIAPDPLHQVHLGVTKSLIELTVTYESSRSA
jgi:hypothetical protein